MLVFTCMYVLCLHVFACVCVFMHAYAYPPACQHVYLYLHSTLQPIPTYTYSSMYTFLCVTNSVTDTTTATSYTTIISTIILKHHNHQHHRHHQEQSLSAITGFSATYIAIAISSVSSIIVAYMAGAKNILFFLSSLFVTITGMIDISFSSGPSLAFFAPLQASSRPRCRVQRSGSLN